VTYRTKPWNESFTSWWISEIAPHIHHRKTNDFGSAFHQKLMALIARASERIGAPNQVGRAD
jgi:hypothetical protein